MARCMRIRGIRLPDGETFPCSRRRIKELFADTELARVSFGSPIRSFRFDNQVSDRPRLIGPVVASLAIDRERQAHLCVYPTPCAAYPEWARDEMSVRVLPHFREWLRAKQSQPSTAVLGHEEIIAEWIGREHRWHELRFL
jgi:hypothetical protein